MSEPERTLWLPDFDTKVIRYLGREWPDILVEKWERNGIGHVVSKVVA